MEGISELIRRHDEYQIEVKLDYDLHRTRRKERYTVEYFFFLPENLDVNEATYTKERFYRDMLLYLRFKAPDLSLDQLADVFDERSPLRKIREKLERFRQTPTSRNATVLDYELKLLACVLKDALAARLRALERALGPTPDEEMADRFLASFLEKTGAVTRNFRDFRREFEDPYLPISLRSAYAFVDEYVSLLVEGRAHLALQTLQRSAAAGVKDRWTVKLANLIRGELDHRRERGYPTLPEEGKDNELFIFRLGVLKKLTAGALYLSVRTEKEGRGIEQLGMALAAGLAMLFATTVAFIYQRAYGTLSVYFFSALIVSYMFKDRLKAMAQGYFLRFRSERVMDLATDLTDPFTLEKIGGCRELVHFVPENRVDPTVVRLRNRDHITEIENSWRAEKVLHYVKEISLYPHRLDKQSRKTALTDIARFNLRNFLLKMDESKKDLFLLRDGRSETISGARVYHVNLVIKFSNLFRVRYERVRLVLDQNGIKRVEPVSVDLKSSDSAAS